MKNKLPEIRYTYVWKWGDKSTILYDLDTEHGKKDFVNAFNEYITGNTPKEIVEHTFEEVRVLSKQEITQILASL